MAKNLGDAFVRVRPTTEGFQQEAQSGLSGGLKKLAGLVAGVFASKAAWQGANALVGRASDLNETVNKSNVIFGRLGPQIMAWSKSSATSLGLPQAAALDAAASFGDMFSQIGFAQKASARMSKSTIKMAADLGSFNNLETSDVLDRISASLRGEYDSLQAVIPNINAARVQTEALARTGKKSAAELTAQEKAAATLAIIHADGSRAAGDFARTQDGLANSNKTLGAMVENLKAKIGSGLLPVWQAASGALRNEVMPPLLALADKWIPKISTALTRWINEGNPTEMLSGIGTTLGSIDWGAMQGPLKNLGTAFKDLGSGLGDVGGSAAVDTISVFSVVIRFAADHVDLLAKALPFLAAGFVAVKAAQAAANLAAIVAVPLKVSEVVVNRQLVKSNVALMASRRTLTATTVSGTAAENVGMLTRIRATAATLVSAAAQKVVAAATRGWAATQWLLNAALLANPLVLIVVGLVALVAALVLAWKKSDTFREIVTKVWEKVKAGVGKVLDWFTKTLLPWFRQLPGRILGFLKSLPGKYVALYRNMFTMALSLAKNLGEKVVDWIRGIPGKLLALGSKFASAGRDLLQGFIDGMKNAAGIISGIAGNVWDSVRGLLNGAIDKINAALEFKISVLGKDVGINPKNIPHLWTGARVTGPTFAMIGDGREPESVMPDSMLEKALARAARAGAAARQERRAEERPRREGPSILVEDRSGDPRRTARETARQFAFAGGL